MSHIGITSGLADAYSLYTMNPLRLSQKPVATLMEAVIGAIYLDCGQEFGPVRDCMRKMGMMYDSPEIEILATKKGQPKELCSCGLEHRWTEK